MAKRSDLLMKAIFIETLFFLINHVFADTNYVGPFTGLCESEGYLGLYQGDCDYDSDCGCGMICGDTNCLDGTDNDCCFCADSDFPIGQRAPPGCMWSGTAPFCDGNCADEPGYPYLVAQIGSGDGEDCWTGWKQLCCGDYSTALSITVAAYRQGHPDSDFALNVCNSIYNFVIEQGCSRASGRFEDACGIAFGIADCIVQEAAGGSVCESITKSHPPLVTVGEGEDSSVVKENKNIKSNCWEELVLNTVAEAFGLVTNQCLALGAGNELGLASVLVFLTLAISFR
eukprot:c5654_g1_i1.p1 GENE.c5654_g1_i1~~c5654_g1_i1.p1  ORF type:complete len:309 (+),score=53.20 c5654_g1_i1:70-927(+)